METRVRFRSKKGQFTTEGRAEIRETYNPKTMRTIRRFYKVPKFKKYVYLLGFDYDKKGKKGKHPFHSEVRFESPKEMTEAEIWDYITSRETELPLGACKMKVKGVEIEGVDYEPQPSYEILSWKH